MLVVDGFTGRIQCICGGGSSTRGEFQYHNVWSCNTKVFTRPWSSLQIESNADGFRMLFCCFENLGAMLLYHGIEQFL